MNRRKLSIVLCLILVYFCTVSPNFATASSMIFIYNQGRSLASSDGQNDIRALRLAWGTSPSSWHYHLGVSSTDANKAGYNTLGSVPDSSKPDGENYGSGCGLYSTAHAIQWMNRRATSSPIDLVRDLISINNEPWDATYGGSYNSYVVAHSNTTVEDKRDTLNEEYMYNLLSAGGCIILNIPGHYILAVEAKRANLSGTEKTWFHIIDSSCRSTLSRLKGDSAYNIGMNSPTGLMNYAGGEYWISIDSCVSSGIKCVWGYRPKGGSIQTTTDVEGNTIIYIENCTYKVIKAFNWRKGPSSSAETVGSAKVGDIVHVKEVIRNSANNMWVKTTDGKYAYAGYKWSGDWNEDGNQYLQFVSDETSISWDQDNVSGRTLQQGNGLDLSGTINSNSTMVSIYGEFYNGSSCYGSRTALFYPNSTSYPMYASGLDRSLKFGTLPASDNLKLVITVQYKFNRGFQVATKTIEKYFKVSGSGSTSSVSSGKWVYQVVTSDGVNIRKLPGLSGEKKIAIFPPTTFTVSEKTTADGYTWGKGISSNGYDGWIVVDNSWTTLISSTVDSSAPTISNVQVYDVTSSGYTVSCSVSDNVGVTRVAFPTWTTNNGQDDLFSDWGNKALGTISNGTATYRVNTKDHNNETGCTYITHIYAYDAAGNTGHVNQSNYGALQVEVPAPTVIPIGIQLDKSTVNVDLGSSGDKSFLLKATVSPANATNKTVHWSSSNQTVARVNDAGLVTPTSVGSAVITAMAENGGYQATCTVNVSTWVNGITINPKEVELNLTDKQTVKLSASVSPNYATNKSVKWASVNPSVASVSENGLVTPVSEGTTEIICTAMDPGGVSAKCKVIVEEKKNRIKLNPEKLTIEGWDYGEIYASVQMVDGSTPRLKWSWSYPSRGGLILHGRSTPNEDNLYYCWVDAYDGVTGKAFPGEYIVTCSTEDGSASATCIVTVYIEPVSAITLSSTAIDLQKDETAKIQATISPSNATRKWVEWKSSDKSVATVSSSGVVKTINPGRAIITCTATDGSGISTSCVVTVATPVLVNAIRLNRTVYEFSNFSEGSIDLKATVSPENAANKNVTWFSSNNNVARVVNGQVTPVAAGYARITCESADGPVGACDIVVHADRIRRLPRSLKAVEAEVFCGTALQEVIIPEGVTTIDTRAFTDCRSLVLVQVPASVRSIAPDAFNGSNVAIVCEESCYATEYARANGIPYIIDTMPGEVVITADKKSLLPGQSVNLQGQVTPDGAPGAIRWQIVEGGNIATIKTEGNRCVLTATGTGHVAVSATAINGVTGTMDISIIERPTTFAIGFDANGGSADVDHMTAEYDMPVGALPAARRDYHSFEGWYTQANGGRRITADTVFSDYDMDNLMLYAHWTENPWSEWVSEEQLPSGAIQKESKQQYRYQDKVYSDWSAWGPWTVDRESIGELKQENQATVYYWYYDLCQNCGCHSPRTVCWDCGHSIGQNWRVAWFDTPKSAGGQFGNSGKAFIGTSQYNRWFYWTDDNGNGDSRTGYQYSTRTYTWGAWSEWSDTVVSGASNRNVQTRTVYRYKAK